MLPNLNTPVIGPVAYHLGGRHCGQPLAGCGSLPGGLTDDYYAQLVETGHRAGANIVIDMSGPSLVAALAAGLDLIKPNTDELAEAAGGTITTIGDAVHAAHELRTHGARGVLVSLGADGALLVDGSGARHGAALVDDVVSTVGAGDAHLCQARATACRLLEPVPSSRMLGVASSCVGWSGGDRD